MADILKLRGNLMGNSALLVLESPWWPPIQDPRRSSVLPFLQGLERVLNTFNIYYATFYDNKGLENALEVDLSHTKERRQIVYIGAHGAEGLLVDDNASNALKLIAKYGDKIEGVMLGCCSIGRYANIIRPALSYSKRYGTYGANWLYSYKYSVDWISSMLIDISILEKVFSYDKLKSRDDIISVFTEGLKVFDQELLIADDGTIPKKLNETIRLTIRPQGTQSVSDATGILLENLCWHK
jgi:hypothetical protein